MYYRVKEPWALRGWKKLPYALRAEYGEKRTDKPLFFDQDTFMALLGCNGTEELDPAAFGKQAQDVVNQLVREGVLEESRKPHPAASGQK